MSINMKAMNCTKIQRWLPPFVDGELAGQIREKVTLHIESCPACRRRIEELKADLALLRSAGTPEPSPYLVSKTMAEVRAVSQPALRRRFALTRTLSTAAAALLVAMGIGTGALLGSGLARAVTSTGDELIISSDESSFVDAFELALGSE